MMDEPEPGFRSYDKEAGAQPTTPIADVVAGRSRVTVLRGAAGVGKSALLGYLCDRAVREFSIALTPWAPETAASR